MPRDRVEYLPILLLAVNLFGTFNVTRAFLPLLKRSRGAIVNNLSTAALAPLHFIPAYSISKAVSSNMTQSLRAFLAGEGVTVHTIFLGPIDNDMSRGLEISKASPQSAALGIFEGLEDGEEDIFPDPASRPLTEGWRAGVVKALASATHDDCACSSVDVRYPLASDDFVSRNDANDH